jgi:Holliday junction resolvase RusA-like endonuclease
MITLVDSILASNPLHSTVISDLCLKERNKYKRRVFKKHFADLLRKLSTVKFSNDLLEIYFFFNIEPASRVRFTRKGKPYIDADYKIFKETFANYLRELLGEQILFSANDPLKITIREFYSLPKSYKINRLGTYKTTKPDLDNTEKCFKDLLTDSGLIKDDSQICFCEKVKLYGLTDFTAVTIEKL